MGLEKERRSSITFHAEGTPLLVSSQLLRHRNLGQLDLARLIKDKDGWIIEVGEVKSSEIGVEQMEMFQRGRIFSSQRFLAAILGYRTRMKSIVENEVSSKKS